MPAPQTKYANFSAAGLATANAAETIIAQTKAVSSIYAASSFAMLFVCVFTVGASTTNVIMTIKRDSLTGTVVWGSKTMSFTAGQTVSFTAGCVDAPSFESTGQIWVLTAIQTSGTAAGQSSNVYTEVTPF